MNINNYIILFITIVISLSTLVNADTNNSLLVEEHFSVKDIMESDIPFQEVKWSPDGSKLLLMSTIPIENTFNSVSSLYVMNADGTSLNKLLSTSAEPGYFVSVSSPQWSPAGDKIAFYTSGVSGGYEVIVNPDGTGLNVIGTDLTDMDSISKTIVNNSDGLRNLIWSPDGIKMVFELETKHRTYIYVADGDGSNLKKLYPDAPNVKPVWSHDSNKVAFSSKNSLLSINVNGTGLFNISNGTDVTKYGNKFMHYSWSPDSSKFVYVASIKEIGEKEQFGIFVTNADGTGTIKIMNGFFDKTIWSPNGSKILFCVLNNGNYEWYVTDFDGKNVTLLQKGSITSVSWSPDGTKIAFLENHSLYTINPDATDKTLLALSISGGKYLPDWASAYAWNPSGSKILYSAVVNLRNGEKADFNTSSNKLDSYSGPIFISNPDGTESVQLTEGINGKYDLIISISPDGSRLAVKSYILSSLGDLLYTNPDLLILKLKGHEEVMSIYALTFIKQGETALISVRSMSNPIENALITLDGENIGFTNETGYLKYVFNEEKGKHSLKAKKEGYFTAGRTINVRPPKSVIEQTNISETYHIISENKNADQIPGFTTIIALIGLVTLYFYDFRKKQKGNV